MLGADALGQRADDLVVGAALARQLDQLRARAGCSGVRRPDRRRRAPGTWWPAAPRRPSCAVAVMNCSCTHTNRSSRAKPAFTLRCSGATCTGFMFWMNSAVTGGPPLRSSGSPVRTGPMRRLVEHAHRRIGDVEAFDQRLVPVIDGAVVVEAAAALVQPRARDRRDAQRRMHVVGAVALSARSRSPAGSRSWAWCRPSWRKFRSRRRTGR